MEIPEPTNFILAVMGATLFGLVSLPHCFGMCGPLHLTVCLSGGKRAFRVLSFFNIGRIITYTAIGLLCGLLGEQITQLYNPSPETKTIAASVKDGSMNLTASVSKMEAGKEDTIAVPKSCCEAAAMAKKDASNDASSEIEAKTGNTIAAPHSCCEIATMSNKDSSNATPVVANTNSSGGTPPEVQATAGLKKVLRRALMFIFPAVILLIAGLKALWKKPVIDGEGSSGWFSRMFNKFSKGGPMACGLAAGLLPCGMLYYAFAVAVSTLSPLLGATFLFVYCFTISFFMELSFLVGTTTFKHMGPKINRLFPYMALTVAGVYMVLFFIK